MDIETKYDILKNDEKVEKEKKREDNDELDGEVDLEEELICALDEIKKLKKNLKQKVQLQEDS